MHLFRSFFHFRLYSTSQISDIAVPRFIFNKEEESAIFLEVYHLCLEAVLASMGVVLLNNVLL